MLLLFWPKSFEVVSMAQVDCNSNYICVFHWLSDLDVFVWKYLHLLSIVPKGWIEAIEEDCWLWSVNILLTHIVSLVAQADKDLLEVGWVISFELQLPIVNSVQGERLTHDRRYGAVVSWLANPISFDNKRFLHFLVADEGITSICRDQTTLVLHIFRDRQIEMLVVKKCANTSMLIFDVVFKFWGRQHVLCNLKLNGFKNVWVFEEIRKLDASD